MESRVFYYFENGMKKKFAYALALLFVAVGIILFVLFMPVTDFSSKSKYIFVRQGEDVKQQVLQQIDTGKIISRKGIFTFVANTMHVWKNVTHGRFEIKKGEGLFSIIRKFQKNRQSDVILNIGRVRTRESLARYLGKNFSTDSFAIIKVLNDSAHLKKFGVDTNTMLSIIIPKTYTFKWDTPLDSILNRFKAAEDSFWNAGNRLQKAANMGFSPMQAYILASIVEEETNKDDEKGNIASVYINRLAHNMALAADPTIKFAMRDFSLKRILYGYLNVNSPYNTYRNKGLPPGPICTPTHITIDAVLNAPATGYLFFVAKSDFSGYHHFSSTFAEHQQYAKEYQTALDELMQKKQEEK
jgi:UPF0755 protein